MKDFEVKRISGSNLISVLTLLTQMQDCGIGKSLVTQKYPHTCLSCGAQVQ